MEGCGEVALPHSIVCDVIALSVFNVDFCTCALSSLNDLLMKETCVALY